MDFGAFRIQTNRNDDLKLLRDGIVRARQNVAKPGHHWQRILVRQDSSGFPEELIKLYHIDLDAGIAEITETVNGRETARRTMDIDSLG